MPYIPLDRRRILWNGEPPHNIGDLNYLITSEILDYLGISDGRQPNYTDYNEVMGVLECAKQELYRRMIAPFEDKKCKENGDVYE